MPARGLSLSPPRVTLSVHLLAERQGMTKYPGASRDQPASLLNEDSQHDGTPYPVTWHRLMGKMGAIFNSYSATTSRS